MIRNGKEDLRLGKNTINNYLDRELSLLAEDERLEVIHVLIERLKIEFAKQDKSGIYGLTQRKLAYNSNKIEGSTLTEKQTSSLFETGTVLASDEVYRAKDIEETRGHFLMFNEMLKTWDDVLTEELIKKYHFRLKSGVFEDLANGYPIGEYKNRRNMVSDIVTALPNEVGNRMRELLQEYEMQTNRGLYELAKFHAEYEKIHPFQDGNGRTGRLLLYKECLRNGLVPIIIQDANKGIYYTALNRAQTEADFKQLIDLFAKEQEAYYLIMRDFLYVFD